MCVLLKERCSAHPMLLDLTEPWLEEQGLPASHHFVSSICKIVPSHSKAGKGGENRYRGQPHLSKVASQLSFRGPNSDFLDVKLIPQEHLFHLLCELLTTKNTFQQKLCKKNGKSKSIFFSHLRLLQQTMRHNVIKFSRNLLNFVVENLLTQQLCPLPLLCRLSPICPRSIACLKGAFRLSWTSHLLA